MGNLDEITGEVKCFPYRRALVSGTFLTLPRKLCKDLERSLAEKAGTSPDNHTVYEWRQYGAEPVYIWCSDFTVTFARTVHEFRNGY